MGQILIAVSVLAGIILLAKFLPDQNKTVGSRCKSCPEYPYCGGGRPRCPRRSERIE